jgi:hypothetical protein
MAAESVRDKWRSFSDKSKELRLKIDFSPDVTIRKDGNNSIE